jgi:hypothetical protein
LIIVPPEFSEKLLQLNCPNNAIISLCCSYSPNFYSMSGMELAKLCEKYAIDYVVMRKQFLQNNQLSAIGLFSVLYENSGFLIYKPITGQLGS